MSDNINSTLEDGVLRVRIDRPEKKNALTRAMYHALAEVLAHADAEPGVRAVLLAGSGGNFTTGNDIADFQQPLAEGEAHPSTHFLQALLACSRPLVAAVQGWAVGIGATMLLHCDLVYAGAGARIMFPFVNLGLTPEAGSSLLLPAMMGRQRAAELLLLGEAVEAARARDYGLVNEVLADDALEAHALDKARVLATRAPAALRATRVLLRGGAPTLRARLAEEETVFLERLGSDEAAEAFHAFMERRPPDFSRFG